MLAIAHWKYNYDETGNKSRVATSSTYRHTVATISFSHLPLAGFGFDHELSISLRVNWTCILRHVFDNKRNEMKDSNGEIIMSTIKVGLLFAACSRRCIRDIRGFWLRVQLRSIVLFGARTRWASLLPLLNLERHDNTAPTFSPSVSVHLRTGPLDDDSPLSMIFVQHR